MIEMQYNFPLLPGQGDQWRRRLGAVVNALDADDADELRPTYGAYASCAAMLRSGLGRRRRLRGSCAVGIMDAWWR